MSQAPWHKFQVGPPSSGPGWKPDCQSLKSIAHVAHVPTALRIAEDRRLRADLVFDESKLNTERIRVVWLSPNDWSGAGGFRYGNIRFHFDWTSLVEGKRAYWVESIAYGIPACRILLTDIDRSGSLDPYDPRAGDGPWWCSPSKEHYWNGNYCLEVMLEEDLDLARLTQVDFVKHHANRCSIDYHTCRYCGVDDDVGGAEFVAAMVSRRPSLDLPGLVAHTEKGSKPSWALLSAVYHLERRIKEGSASIAGLIDRSDPGARALARAVLGSLGNPAIQDDLPKLTAHFRSADDLQGAIADAIAAATGLPDANRLL